MFEYNSIPQVGCCLSNQGGVYSLNEIAKQFIKINASDEEKVHLLLFFQAISYVNMSYLIFNIDVIKEKKENNDEKSAQSEKTEEGNNQYLERTFAYELYRQWQNLLCCYKFPQRLDAEIGKKISNIGNFEQLKALKCESKEPDLVLHDSQAYIGNHIIACEIKRKKYLDKTKIKNDLEKLFMYMHKDVWDEHPYQYGCFIVVNELFNNLETVIRSLKDDLITYATNVNFNHLLCITYKGDSLNYDTLNNILGI